jgi:uncharacterized protein (TIGR02266 family)
VSASDERRSNALLRIPFVRRCQLAFEDQPETSAFLVNLNVLGCFVALDLTPAVGTRVTLRFKLPGNERELTAVGVVAWLNRWQEHPVHSLPLGFGLRFASLSAEDRARIGAVMDDYLRRHPFLV